MKIDPYSTGAIATQPSLQDPTTARGKERTAPSASDDHVSLSSDVDVVRAATAAAHGSPEIRQDVVDRMRAVLKSGQVGSDPDRLADAIINSWIETPSSEKQS
ncbi:MAG TPA: flagellar biosynthesis anti-sigma factor FlgM [Vicinamibacterales bacterium]|nr:flagellar biosynthesis anti-sigma factor FlgM [Vicinamibacterales bacterium]